ncbi:serine peptidase, MEROPS family S24 [Cyclonatronum proteinivorum]|uniref:Serine peptidase, MEROPS family S24 n=1 Tax=Cyclonatronum proteinivorum TaxID=1457365 RepID=A0A345UKC4_9BACT|nr:translesion error-prone DNA polymerase V autoproteolytic subunit [Cyclonatronum proteinivorum]AXJ00926.1 serine peptidase, MEROPS family S24 [Cyclonatronum proteinivorum]
MLKVTEIQALGQGRMSPTQMLPLYSESVQAGFPSPAQDHIEKKLDLNDYLVSHPVATFFVRVQGDSMREANIHSGDILIVDRALEAVSGKIIVAVLNGEFTVKRLKRENGEVWLLPENDDFDPIPITPESDFEVWGVVTWVIHKAQ